MPALIYLILAFYVGYVLLKKLLPGLFALSGVKSLYGSPSLLCSRMAVIPAAFLTGSLLMTWITYLSAYLFRDSQRPLLFGNIISFGAFAVIAVIDLLQGRKEYASLLAKWKKAGVEVLKNLKDRKNLKELKNFFSTYLPELTYISFITALTAYLMFHSFHIKDGFINIGFSVYGDFGSVLPLIRTFSYGSNFPTEHALFPDGHMRYHFMFQFMAGNLEFLGLRLDWAFNLISILAMVAFLMLLYSLAVLLTGKRWVGIMTGLMFYFRSSFAFFTFLKDQGSIAAGISKILNGTVFVGNTYLENTGLWSIKDFVNQRHFVFSIGLLLLFVIAFYPHFYSMVEILRDLKTMNLKGLRQKNRAAGKPGQGRKAGRGTAGSGINGIIKAAKQIKTAKPHNGSNERGKSTNERGKYASESGKYVRAWIREFALVRDSWLPQNIFRAAALGILLGLMSFWHGAVVISILYILFFMAIFSRHRLDYIVTAVLGVAISYLQTLFFMGAGNSAVNPRIALGYLAENKSLFGIAAYYVELLGIFPFVLLAGMIVIPKGGRWLAFAFSIPFFAANAVSLAPDLVINHKYIVISVLLLNIFAADFVYGLAISRRTALKGVAAAILLMLTITGISNIITQNNIDKSKWRVETGHPITVWAVENTRPEDIFLTHEHSMHPLFFSGRKIFYGWGYNAWSAGYDTKGRAQVVAEIYGGNDPQKLKELVKKHRITFIVIENENRNPNNHYKLNEELIKDTFTLAWKDERYGIEIYSTE